MSNERDRVALWLLLFGLFVLLRFEDLLVLRDIGSDELSWITAGIFLGIAPVFVENRYREPLASDLISGRNASVLTFLGILTVVFISDIFLGGTFGSMLLFGDSLP